MTSYEKTTKMKVADLKKIRNFVVDNFLFEIILLLKTMFEFVKFEIQIL